MSIVACQYIACQYYDFKEAANGSQAIVMGIDAFHTVIHILMASDAFHTEIDILMGTHAFDTEIT